MPEALPPAYYPVLLDLRGEAILVVGGGEIARRKVEGLLEAQARITVVAPLCEAMPESVALRVKPYETSDLEGHRIVFAATDDGELNARIAQEARIRGMWVNAVDDAAHCSFILPAVVRRGALVLAISTAGSSPALARRLKEGLERQFGTEYADLLQMLWELRQAFGDSIRASGMSFDARRLVWESILDLPLLEQIREGRLEEARKASIAILEAAFGGTRL